MPLQAHFRPPSAELNVALKNHLHPLQESLIELKIDNGELKIIVSPIKKELLLYSSFSIFIFPFFFILLIEIALKSARHFVNINEGHSPDILSV